MKVVFSVVALLLMCISNTMHAQNFIGKLIVGVNGSQIDGDNRSGYNQPGFMVGIGTAFPINDKWSFEPEMLFSQKGSRTSTEETDEKGLPLIRFRLNYVELPLIVNYHLSDFWIFCGGLHANLLINAKADAGDNREYQEDTKNWKTFDMGSSLGLELRPYQWFAFNMRLSYSLLAANKLVKEVNTTQYLVGIRSGLFNNTVSVSARFILNPKSKK
jgi:Outer membrane protein beta-barrel domain